MAFRDLPQQEQGVELLQLSLERSRLGHAYLFSGAHLDELETVARALAQTLNCLQPVQRSGAAIDACGECLQCRKIAHDTHPDVHWVRPESKLRIVTVSQIRDLMREIQLRPGEGTYKVAVISGADRMKTEAANAFLKTLEEPPAKSILILLTTEPQRLLETILSRCLRLNFGGELIRSLSPQESEWLTLFTNTAAQEHKSLLARYRLLDVLLKRLAEIRAAIDTALSERSPLEQYQDIEKDLREKWEAELTAAIEAEYRRQRAHLLSLLQWWLRDVWLLCLQNQHLQAGGKELLNFPQLTGSPKLAARLSEPDARANLEILEQLQGRLATNVQEALALEVGLLKLRL